MGPTTTRESYLVELIDGREMEKPLPKKLHIWIQTNLIVKLPALLSKRDMAMPELNVLTGVRTADGRREWRRAAVPCALQEGGMFRLLGSSAKKASACGQPASRPRKRVTSDCSA